MTATILTATPADAAIAAPLFDAYRMFYGLRSDLAASQQYLEDRLRREESIVLYAIVPQHQGAVGFAQLYPTFSSLQLAPVLILNDLFVRPDARRLGIARALLLKTHEIARQRGAVQVTLETARSNDAARPLYESEGYRTDPTFDHYHLGLT